jgi:hypothetical protein
LFKTTDAFRSPNAQTGIWRTFNVIYGRLFSLKKEIDLLDIEGAVNSTGTEKKEYPKSTEERGKDMSSVFFLILRREWGLRTVYNVVDPR